MKSFKQLAIIGATASGKTSLAIKVAKKNNAYILSLDSLSIYKEIDIVSAKPSKEEQEGIVHYGLDHVYPHEQFDVTTFIKLYHDIYTKCLEDNKNLVIVGGTGFYLKSLINGISMLPNISDTTKNKTQKYLQDLQESHSWLHSLDPAYMSNIASNDSYRIEKALNIYLETKQTPTEYFECFPPSPTIKDRLPLYQIEWDRQKLRERISRRTQIMINNGLINEVCMLEQKYSCSPHCMKAIGIKETLAYLNGIYSKKELIEKITTNTARLAKRQTTFNNSQFDEVIKGSVEALEKILL